MAAFSILRLLPVLMLGFFILEVASIIVVGQSLGVFTTLLLIIADIILGVSIIRTAGTNAMNEVRMPFRTPGFEAKLAGGVALRVIAGILFIVPGFISDILALFALAPPVQAWLGRRFKPVTTSNYRAWENRSGDDYRKAPTIIEGEVIELSGELNPPPPGSQGSSDNRN